MSARRIGAIIRKELREYRRNRSVVVTMAVIPILFSIQPLVAVLSLGTSSGLGQEHVLIYMLGIPILVPVFVAAFSVAGERQQQTLEPVLTTPIPRDEFLLGKALAALIPSLAVAYLVFGIFVGCVLALAHPGVAGQFLRAEDLIAQVLFTPLVAGWTIWVAIAISTRVSDVRVAQQLSLLASLPSILVTVVVALNLLQPSPALAVGATALLLVLNLVGWRVAARLFDRERLIAGTS